jgi:peptidoglycan/xylan/chitin deacetylase (PgdA/CDA1 family)
MLGLLLLAGCGGSAASSSTRPAAASHHRTAATRSAPAGGSRSVPALIPPANPTPASVSVPVLTYHRVAPLSAVGQPDLKVDPANFAAEMAALKGAGHHAITEAQLFNALYRHAKLPPKPVLISVDDGYVDDVRTILPTLQRLHMVATFFVITGRMTEPGFLTAGQIRQLDRAGMDIGDHTVHHVDLRLLTPSELDAETAGSKAVLERVVGHPVYAFAYPFGAESPRVVAAVGAAGYTLAFTTAGGITESTAAPLTMPRVHVGRTETPSGLLAEIGNA